MKTHLLRVALVLAFVLQSPASFAYDALKKTVYVPKWDRTHEFEIPIDSTICPEQHGNGRPIAYGTALRIEELVPVGSRVEDARQVLNSPPASLEKPVLHLTYLCGSHLLWMAMIYVEIQIAPDNTVSMVKYKMLPGQQNVTQAEALLPPGTPESEVVRLLGLPHHSEGRIWKYGFDYGDPIVGISILLTDDGAVETIDVGVTPVCVIYQ